MEYMRDLLSETAGSGVGHALRPQTHGAGITLPGIRIRLHPSPGAGVLFVSGGRRPIRVLSGKWLSSSVLPETASPGEGVAAPFTPLFPGRFFRKTPSGGSNAASVMTATTRRASVTPST